MALPKGVRLRNPYNLRYNANTAKYIGCTGEEGGYCVFDTPVNGIRAANLNLQSYLRRGIDTIGSHDKDHKGIVETWAPSEDGNNVDAYVKFVTGRTTWDAYDRLALDSPSVLLALGKAMIGFENGQQPYPDSVLLEGINAALGGES